MSLVRKIKDILFEEEEEYTEPIKISDEKKEEKPKVVKIEPTFEEEKPVTEKKEVTSERELFKSDNNFKFPDFDEEEFASSISKAKPTPNVLEYERKKVVEKRTDYGRYEKVETKEYTEKRKFKPSPIISPVYGILNQDYKADDIVKKPENTSNIDIELVRKKAFEPEEKKNEKTNEIDEPVVTFFEEKETIKVPDGTKEDNYKTINDLLEGAADEIDLEDTIEIPAVNSLNAIEEELEKIETEPAKAEKKLDDTLDKDLYELIDSMYEEREEE